MIINRYITKEVLLNFIVVTSIVLFVAISNQFIHLLAKVAIGQLPGDLLLKAIGLSIPELLASLMPLGFFVAILFVYSRLHADSEMSVLFTCGINWAHITKVMLKIAAVIAIIVLIFTIWLIPVSTEYREQVLSKGEAIGIMQAIIPGQFQTLDDGRLMFYVEDTDQKNKEQLSNIFIAVQPQTNAADPSVSIITAAHGYLEHKDNEQAAENFFLILKDGHRYTGRSGALNYTAIDFAEYGREIKVETEKITDSNVGLIPTSRLLQTKDPREIAELQWRLSLPLSVLILGFLAVPLATVNPRQGKFAKFLPAILLYIAYLNLILVTKRWIAAGVLSPYCGVWSVHLGFFALSCLLLAKASGRLTQLYRKYFRNK